MLLLILLSLEFPILNSRLEYLSGLACIIICSTGYSNYLMEFCPDNFCLIFDCISFSVLHFSLLSHILPSCVR